MMAPKNFFLKAFFLANCLGLGVAHAAAIFDPGSQPIAYVGMPEVSSNIATSGSERLYTIDYSSQVWSGNLHSYPLSSIGVIGTVDDWDDGAAAQVDAQNLTSGTWNPTGRKIVTMNVSGVPFVWGSLSSTQKTALDSVTAAISGSTSSPVLNYIRGDRSNEEPNGNDYRARSSVLGDIIHSTPVYCDAATCGAATVFVGSNDGMLHAINAASGSGGGSERFAYIPSMLIGKLKDLKTDPYVHKYFVDGNMDIRKFGSTTILAGALGSGGKGLFALNVSNAAATDEADAASKVLWEATNTSIGYANLGHTYGQPRLATLSGGTAALIVGNGYNSGVSSLFVINANTGTVLNEIVAASGTGLSSPMVVDSDVDGYADIAYAGDIDGNLWKFDLVANSSTLLFSQSQAITMAPGVRSHPNGGFMVTFVTGRMFTAADKTDTATHSAYGIWDGAPAANDTLLTQTLTEATYSAVTPSIRVRSATSNVPDWTSGAGHHKGWKTDLPVGGERVVGDGAYVTGSVFVFLSSNPTASTTATPPGESWFMHLNALTGGDNGAIRFDLNEDQLFSTADQLSGGESPVGRYLGGGVRSQRTELAITGFSVYLGNYDQNSDPVIPHEEAGVAGGHLDMEIYYDFANNCPTTDGTTGSRASGSVTFNYASGNTQKNVTNLIITANGEQIYSGAPGNKSPNQLDDFLNNKSSTNYTITSNYSGNSNRIRIRAKSNGTIYNGTITVTITTSGSSPGYTKNNLTGGTNDVPGTGATSTCEMVKHIHEYDDVYDVTGLDMLNASDPDYDLANAISSTATQFKVIAQNQYLSPAASIHIGNSSYVYNVNAGYVPIKNFTTSASLDVTTLPVYTRANVGSLAINVPVDAFTPNDWWNIGTPPNLVLPADVRVGVHPTQAKCVRYSAGSRDGNMFQPVIPPATVTATGNGTLGYNSGTTSLTATGVRHNGALGIQVIRADTPNSAIEQSVPGRPEYGYRVKAANYNTYVLAEYTTFWHDKVYPDRCYGTTGWTKLAATDTRECGKYDTTTTKQCATPKSAAAGTDPKIGAFASGGGGGGGSGVYVVSVTTTHNAAEGTTTVVTTYSDGTTTTTVIVDGVITDPPWYAPTEVLGRVNWRELRQ